MKDIVEIWLPDTEFTDFCGASLGKTLYRIPLTISLSGELGAGKTTFLQGFFRGLGIVDPVVSPTYALEQRYQLPATSYQLLETVGELIHIDLYRLDEQHAKELVSQTDDHRGIRCIEWADRAEYIGDIHIDLKETGAGLRPADEKEGRHIRITFSDIDTPSQSEIKQWRKELKLPEHICRHCDAVADFCEQFGKEMMQRGHIVRPLALRRAAELHDLLRFVDFKPGASHLEHDVKEESIWKTLKQKYQGLLHEPACAAFLEEKGYPELASIVAVHGLRPDPSERDTIEQKLLYYADKRFIVDQLVTLDERFADFAKRYTGDSISEKQKLWYKQAKEIEKELFPDGIPN